MGVRRRGEEPLAGDLAGARPRTILCRLHVGARREWRQVKIHELCADGRRRVTFATDLRVAVLLNAFELCDTSQCCALVVVVAVRVSTLLWRAVSRAGAQSHKRLIARGCHK